MSVKSGRPRVHCPVKIGTLDSTDSVHLTRLDASLCHFASCRGGRSFDFFSVFARVAPSDPAAGQSPGRATVTRPNGEAGRKCPVAAAESISRFVTFATGLFSPGTVVDDWCRSWRLRQRTPSLQTISATFRSAPPDPFTIPSPTLTAESFLRGLRRTACGWLRKPRLSSGRE